MSRSITGAAAAALLSLTTFAQADVIYVNANLGSGLDDGSSWDDAYRGLLGLKTAIDGATAGDQIWVAAGFYLPAIGTPRTASFILRSGVEIYGGFAGGETELGDRDPVANVVTLSGDLDQNDQGLPVGSNSYHVVHGGSANNTTLLSGVTITGGLATGSGSNDRGGGLYMTGSAAPRIEDCIVRANRCTFGGGACYNLGADPSFARVTFESNIGGAFGGAFDIAAGGSTVVSFDSCRFIDNFANRAGGVEVFGSGAVATFVNCLFLDNRASTIGGAMYVLNSGRTEIYNSTVVNNDGGNTGGLHLTGLASIVRNTIVWGNTDNDGNSSQILGNATNVQFSNIEGGWAGAGNDNIDAAPLFEDISAGNANLAAGSPGIDAGSNALVPPGTDTDLDGGPRFVDDPDVVDTGPGSAPIVDMGALERDIPCPGDADGNGEVAFGDLLIVLGNWGPCDGCAGDLNGDGQVNFQDILIVLGAWGLCP